MGLDPPEPAVRHDYDPVTGEWKRSDSWVAVNSWPFQEGTLRVTYGLVDLTHGNQQCLAKHSKDPADGLDVYLRDVEMQSVARQIAQEYNKRNPPKRVEFLLPWVVELPRRTTPNGAHLILGAEPYLPGEYKKHTNNFGYISPESRATPQAFSHFSWVNSGGRLLVSDIQGVEDYSSTSASYKYTDPQIHSAGPGSRYGKGDMGTEGILKFFETHQCTAVCQFLGITQYSPYANAVPPQAQPPHLALPTSGIATPPRMGVAAAPAQQLHAPASQNWSNSAASSANGRSLPLSPRHCASPLRR
eukprot:TRINITY_DN67640_c0_g1_i1.p1 TRINITY_DN67640_c0_g1~~TRINITY_DN67640_c0_g1_i1.p1  ORF type:complete len:302 (+),score=22.04 TRINITY_DN67640_c0_g1_i1:28-933(+)